MPLSKVALVRSALLFIVVALVALISIVGVTLWLVDRTQVYSDTVLHTRHSARASPICEDCSKTRKPASADTF